MSLDVDPHRGRKRVVLVMVGLPARGKTFIAQKLTRYLTWLGYRARLFNVGIYRRDTLGARQSADFFDPRNAAGLAGRTQVALAALDDLLAWLHLEGDVAIYDATNVARERRRWVRERCEAAGVRVVFIESASTDQALIEANILQTKLSSPDYVGVDADQAAADFRARIAFYADAAEPLDEAEGSWVRLIDVGRRVEMHEIRGYLLGRIVFFLMNLHIASRSIYLTRHGESTFNVEDRIGGDPSLSPQGQRYAAALPSFVNEHLDHPRLEVWTSTLRRTRETAAGLTSPRRVMKALDEIDAGLCDSLTYAEVAAQLPDEYESRKADKLRYRYPRGESYQDVIGRVDPVIVELERTRNPVMVVAHNAILRALIAYFTDQPRDDVPHLNVPLHQVLELRPRAYGCDVVMHHPLGRD